MIKQKTVNKGDRINGVYDWLDENKLEILLNRIYKKDFIRNKKVPNSDVLFRPDFRNDEIRLIVEFDGPRHYTQAKTCITDVERDELYTSMGYKVVRIPYYLQLETRTLKLLFNLDYEMEQDYPHGFNEKGVVLPSDFCYLGTLRFNEEIKTISKSFPCIVDEIKETLKVKASIKENWAYVLNPNLFHLKS